MSSVTIDSRRPVLAPTDKSNRASFRFSTYSKTSEAPTYKTDISDAPTYASNRTDPDIRKYESSVDRLDDRRIQNQRYVMDKQKMDEMDKLAVLGKVEKSLQRRFHNQDATMREPRERKLVEKAPPQTKQPVEKK